MPGLTVDLEDTSGDLLAATTTDASGNYSFNQLSSGNTDAAITPGASATGMYQVVLSMPKSMQLAGAAPSPLQITSGDTNLNGVNFTISPTSTPPPTPAPRPWPDPRPGRPFFPNNWMDTATAVISFLTTTLRS